LPDWLGELDRVGGGAQEVVGAGDAGGVAANVTGGMGLESWAGGCGLAGAVGKLKAAGRLHPWKVGEAYTGKQDLEPFGDTASDTMVVAVSEVGLDAAMETPLEVQREVLEWFIGLAQERGFPLILHQQAPLETFLEIWDSIEGRRPAAAIHSFAGGRADAD